MRIWLQCAGALGRDPLWGPYNKALKDYSQQVGRPGTTVELHGVDVMTPWVDRSLYFESLNTREIIENAIQAEKKGYDAFAITCMLDPGYFELREVVNIPVTFPLESSCHLASLLARKFALLSYNEIMRRKVTDYVKYRFGLGDRLVPSRCMDITVEEMQNGFKDPEPLLRRARQVVKQAAEQDADMVIPLCGALNMIFITHEIREIDGIPLMDALAAPVKLAEILVDLKNLGVDRANRGQYTRLSKEELSAVRKLYKVE